MNPVAFIIIVIIVFIILYLLYNYFFSNKLKLLTETIPINTSQTKEIKSGGNTMSYSYGVWVFINDFGPSTIDKTIIKRQGEFFNLYINKGDLNCKIATTNTAEPYNESINTENMDWKMPIGRWVHILVSVKNNEFIDYFINGRLIKSDKAAKKFITPPETGTINLGCGSCDMTGFITKVTRWSKSMTTDGALAEYLAGNGEIWSIPYSVRVDLLKDDKVQSTYRAW